MTNPTYNVTAECVQHENAFDFIKFKNMLTFCKDALIYKKKKVLYVLAFDQRLK